MEKVVDMKYTMKEDHSALEYLVLCTEKGNYQLFVNNGKLELIKLENEV